MKTIFALKDSVTMLGCSVDKCTTLDALQIIWL